MRRRVKRGRVKAGQHIGTCYRRAGCRSSQPVKRETLFNDVDREPNIQQAKQVTFVVIECQYIAKKSTVRLMNFRQETNI